ncbi:3124_t:CDS:2 [Dentiscutata erythropus]|uniref:3124_t:CDS:1 n=1 Tax=Dentiscutata erythropus TaxID=1348616 RepID=A0A9N9JDE8_9GLOM|nr:3124_t:CDS:2 [Dentiscutata erythropus]
MKETLLMIISLIILFSSFLYVSPAKSNSVPTQCYNHPNPLNGKYREAVSCPTSKQKVITSNLAATGSKNMFDVTLTCGVKNVSLCDEVKKTFETAGNIISSALILNSIITINASFIDFCVSMGECGGKSGLVTLGGACPARSIPLQDDDGLVRLYPQALVKQFQFKTHPEYGPYDILAMFNSAGTNFWFEGDGNMGHDQQDFLYVVLHELIHGLGFASNWGDYINENNPKAMTPDIALVPDGSDSTLKFNGFMESAFDKYIINMSSGHRTSEITNKLNTFANETGTKFSDDDDFNAKFKSSPQYKLALNMMKTVITPSSLGFLPHDSNDLAEAIILETHLNPYQEGSSVSHVDFNTYNTTNDFLMKYLADLGVNLRTMTTSRGCTEIIGPKLKLILETIGYATSDYPNPYIPSVTITSNNLNTNNLNTNFSGNIESVSSASPKMINFNFETLIILNLVGFITTRYLLKDF